MAQYVNPSAIYTGQVNNIVNDNSSAHLIPYQRSLHNDVDTVEEIRRQIEITWANISGKISDNPELQSEFNKLIGQIEDLVQAQSSMFDYKGSVLTYDDLPATAKKGDCYNVVEHGANYVYSGSVWDKLSEDIDLSGYLTKEEFYEILDPYLNKFSELDEYIAQVKEIVDNLVPTFEEIRGQITELQNNVSSLSADLTQEITDRESLLDRFEEHIADADAHHIQIDISELQEKVNTNISNISELRTDLDNLSNMVDTELDEEAETRNNADITLQNNINSVVSDVEALQSGKADKTDLDNYYNKEQIDSMTSTLFKYKGQVNTASELPSSGNAIGDTYNVIEDGANYTWNGETWDKLSETVDLSHLLSKADFATYQAQVAGQFETVNASISALDTKVDTEVANLTQEINTKASASELDNFYNKETIDGKVTNIETSIASWNDKLNEYYNKDEIDAKMSSLFEYKGQVETESDLPMENNKVGDTYNVIETEANYTWNGESWDRLSENIDLSPYAKIEDVTAMETELRSYILSQVSNVDEKVTALATEVERHKSAASQVYARKTTVEEINTNLTNAIFSETTKAENDNATLKAEIDSDIEGLVAQDLALDNKINVNAEAISGIDAKVEENKTEIANNKSTITTLSGKIDTHISDVTNEFEVVNERITNNKQAIDNAIADVVADLGRVEREYKTADNQLDSRLSELTDVVDNLAVNNQSVHENLQGQINAIDTAYKTKDTELQEHITNTNTLLQNVVIENNTSHTEISNTIAGVSANLTETANTINERIDDVETDYKAADSALDTRVKTLEEDTALDELSDKVDTLETKHDSDIEAINTSIAGIDNAYKSADVGLQSNIDLLQENVEQEISEINSNIETLDTAYKAADNTLNTKIDNVESSLTELIETTEDSLEGKIDTAKSDLTTTINSTKTELQGNINTVDRKIDTNIELIQTYVNSKTGELKTRIAAEEVARASGDTSVREYVQNISTDVYTALNAAIKDAQDANDALQSTLESEISNTAADINEVITTKEDALKDADTALDNKINTVNSSLTQSIATTNANIAQEVTDRQNADLALKDELKDYVDTKTSAVFKYKGQVQTESDLPVSDNQVGDCYNIVEGGYNCVWNGATWDKLSETVDLTPFLTKEEFETYKTQTATRLINIEDSVATETLARQNDITTVNSSITNVSTQLTNKIDTAKSDLNTKIDNNVTTITGRLNSLDSTTQLLRTDITTTASNLSETRLDVRELDTELTRLKAIVDEESEYSHDTYATKEALEAHATENEESFTSVNEQITTLSETIGANKTDIEGKLATETNARTNADSELNTAINNVNTALTNEVTARTSADTSLSNDITTVNSSLEAYKTSNDEEVAKKADSTEVASLISTEQLARQLADTQLRNEFQAADETINTAISNLDTKVDEEIAGAKTYTDEQIADAKDELNASITELEEDVNSKLALKADKTEITSLDNKVEQYKIAQETALGDEVSARTLGDEIINAKFDEYYNKTQTDGFLNAKVDKTIYGTNGKALIFNESDGGGSKFEANDGHWSFAGVNDGTNDIRVQLYAIDRNDGNVGPRINLTSDIATYSKDRTRTSEEYEIAIKQDITNASQAIESEISEIDNTIVELKDELSTSFESIEDRFIADEDLIRLSAKESDLSAEITNRQNADNTLSSKIDADVASAKSEINTTINTKIEEVNETISDVEDKFDDEIETINANATALDTKVETYNTSLSNSIAANTRSIGYWERALEDKADKSDTYTKAEIVELLDNSDASIEAERLARISADETLETKIDTDVENAITECKEYADGKETSLTTRIDAVEAAYIAADADTDYRLDQDENRIDDLEDTIVLKANSVDVYSKTAMDEILDTRLSSIFIYKGQVASESDLPKNNNRTGDCYNVQDTDANYAWNGSSWDKLSETIDLTPYLKVDDFEAIIAGYYNKLDAEEKMLEISDAAEVRILGRIWSEVDIEDPTVGHFEVGDLKITDKVYYNDEEIATKADIATSEQTIQSKLDKKIDKVTELTTANRGDIVQYVGENGTYKNGYFYKYLGSQYLEFAPSNEQVQTEVATTIADFKALLATCCEGRSFTAEDVTHGQIGYHNLTDRYSFTAMTDDDNFFSISMLISDFQEAGVTFNPALGPQQGVTFTCNLSNDTWKQVNVQPVVDISHKADKSEVAKVGGRVTTLETDVDTLETNLATETQARIDGDNALKSKLWTGSLETGHLYSKKTNTAGGYALIFNEGDGGGSQVYDKTDDVISYVGTNLEEGHGDENGVNVQLYSKNKTTNEGVRININTQKAYYLKGANVPNPAGRELAVQEDITNLQSQIDDIDETAVTQTEFEELQETVETKADITYVDIVDGKIAAVVDQMLALEAKYNEVRRSNVEVIELYDGNDDYYEDREKDYIMSGQIDTDLHLLAKSVTLREMGINAAIVTSYTTGDFNLSDVDVDGEYIKETMGNSIMNIHSDSYITIRDCQINPEVAYNGLEIGLTSGLAKGVIIDNVDFSGTFSNNAINIFGTDDNAIITISNCHFHSVSNAIRLSNRANKKVTLNVINCTVDQWETGQYAGMIILQDYTTSGTDNLFAPSKVTINIQNLTGPNGKITCNDASEICGTKDDNQVIYVYSSGFETYDANRYPTITVQ